MCDGLSVQTPATTERDVSFDSGEVFDSPSPFLTSATVPHLSSATFDSSGESSTGDPPPTPEASTIPSSTDTSPNHNRAQSEISLRDRREGSPPARPDPKACELCQEEFNDSEQLVNHLNEMHQDIPNFCGRTKCRMNRRWNRRELIRHLRDVHKGPTTPEFRCRCPKTFTRKYKFKDHLKKFTCKGDQPMVCWCGIITFDCRTGGDIQGFKDHIEACGQGKKGRPPKERNGTMQERKITGGVLTPE